MVLAAVAAAVKFPATEDPMDLFTGLCMLAVKGYLLYRAFL